MGVILRQSFKATIVSYIGAAIGAFLVIYLYPKCLTPSQIGLTKVLVEAGLFFSVFAQLGMVAAANKFFPFFRNPENNHNGFSFLLLVIPFIGFLIFLFAFVFFKNDITSLFQDKSEELNDFLVYIVPFTFFMLYIALFETYAALHQRIVMPRLIKEILVRILTILIILLYFKKIINWPEFIFSFTSIYGIAALLNIIYFRKIYKINFKPNFKFLKNPLRKEMLLFIGFIIFIGIGSTISSKIDIFMVSQKVNLTGAGIFTIAFFIASFIEMPSKAMFQITTPIISESLKNNDWAKISDLYKRVSINQLIISSMIFLIIWINTDNIFSIMPNGHIYKEGKYVILFIGLAKIIDAVTGLNGIILGNSKYYFNFIYFIFFITIITVISNLILIPLFGIVGSAMATAISISLYNIIMVIFVKLIMKVQPFSWKTIIAIIVIGIFFFIHDFIPQIYNAYIDAVIRTLLFLFLFIVVIYQLKLSLDINTFLKRILKTKIKDLLHFKF